MRRLRMCRILYDTLVCNASFLLREYSYICRWQLVLVLFFSYGNISKMGMLIKVREVLGLDNIKIGRICIKINKPTITSFNFP